MKAAAPIFTPDAATLSSSNMTAFTRFCAERAQRRFPDDAALYDFSCDEVEAFWRLFLAWSKLRCEGEADPVCTSRDCEAATFFPRLRLSYAENLLRLEPGAEADRPALAACHADGSVERLTRGALRQDVARLALALRRLGLKPGDRVTAVAANNREAVVAALAVVALGASFSTASPDMGPSAIVERFEQLEPVLLFCPLRRDRAGALRSFAEQSHEVLARLPSLRTVVALDDGSAPADCTLRFATLSELLAEAPDEAFDWPRFPFNQPAFILFSSGTTGRPKCLIHGAGGTLIEHVKEHRLHGDLRPGDKLFFHTSAAWMMWNWQLSALASGVEIVLYDGPVDDPTMLWRLVARERVSHFGTSPSYLQISEESGFVPRRALDLTPLCAILSTGSTLHDRQFHWIQSAVKPLPVQSLSGGTDIIGCFVLGNPNLPVHAGEIQCRSLGMKVAAADPDAQGIGELVCRTPFPSRPLGLYGDVDGERFHATYFSRHPGAWTHGDFIELTPSGGARIHGRSDGVLNVRGIRIGPAEIYRILQNIPEIREAMAVEQRAPGELGGSRMVLLVVLRQGRLLDGPLMLRIRKELARRGSPAHVPDVIAQVPELPMTHSGKRSERAARDALNGSSIANLNALRNPGAIEGLRRHPALGLDAAEDDATGKTPLSSAPLEQQLRALWEEIFRVAPIGLDDNFFDLGGRSLLAYVMTTKLRERFGIEAPPTILLQAPTIGAMAAALRRSEARPRFSSVTPLRSDGLRPPLFIAHGFGGNVFELVKIARAIPADRPIYALQARGLDPRDEPHRRIEDMADFYIGEIRAVQPAGPYALSGFSSGGLIAFEMARRLREKGERVDFVGLLDTGLDERNLPRLQRLRLGLRRLGVVARHVVALPREEKLAYAQRMALLALDAVRLRHGRQSPRRPQQEEGLPPHFLRVRDCGRAAICAYRPGRYDGRVSFFRVTSPHPLAADPLPVWRRRAAALDVYDVPGTHETFIEDPNVAVLGERIARCLEPIPADRRSRTLAAERQSGDVLPAAPARFPVPQALVLPRPAGAGGPVTPDHAAQ